MSTANSLQAPGEPPPSAGQLSAEKGLMAVAEARPGGLFAADSPLARLPVELDVSIPVHGFKVRNLLAVRPGEVIETQWVNGEDLPIAAGEVQLAWSEFEVIDTQLAMRVTRLA